MASSARFTKEEDKDMYDVLLWNEAFIKNFYDCRMDKTAEEFYKEVVEASSQFSQHFARVGEPIHGMVQDYISVDMEMLFALRRQKDMKRRYG
jgi:hypothetical protein